MEAHTEIPSKPRGKVDWEHIAAEARRVAPKWIEVPTLLNPSTVTQIRAGRYRHIRPDEFEVTSRRADDGSGRATIYVRVRQ